MHDHPVAGFCAFWLVFDEIHINNVAVRPQFRGRGIGTTLMHHVLAEGRELGARRATLEVRASNEAARRLYERLGFYVAATRRNYYTNPVEDALILWRDESS
jgi:ribosomal-protein-alanine N-acetyltransferase